MKYTNFTVTKFLSPWVRTLGKSSDLGFRQVRDRAGGLSCELGTAEAKITQLLELREKMGVMKEHLSKPPTQNSLATAPAHLPGQPSSLNNSHNIQQLLPTTCPLVFVDATPAKIDIKFIWFRRRPAEKIAENKFFHHKFFTSAPRFMTHDSKNRSQIKSKIYFISKWILRKFRG